MQRLRPGRLVHAAPATEIEEKGLVSRSRLKRPDMSDSHRLLTACIVVSNSARYPASPAVLIFDFFFPNCFGYLYCSYHEAMNTWTRQESRPGMDRDGSSSLLTLGVIGLFGRDTTIFAWKHSRSGGYAIRRQGDWIMLTGYCLSISFSQLAD